MGQANGETEVFEQANGGVLGLAFSPCDGATVSALGVIAVRGHLHAKRRSQRSRLTDRQDYLHFQLNPKMGIGLKAPFFYPYPFRKLAQKMRMGQILCPESALCFLHDDSSTAESSRRSLNHLVGDVGIVCCPNRQSSLYALQRHYSGSECPVWTGELVRYLYPLWKSCWGCVA